LELFQNNSLGKFSPTFHHHTFVLQSNENGIKAVVSEDAVTALNGNRFYCFAGGSILNPRIK
jgi:hypothetical protein